MVSNIRTNHDMIVIWHSYNDIVLGSGAAAVEGCAAHVYRQTMRLACTCSANL